MERNIRTSSWYSDDKEVDKRLCRARLVVSSIFRRPDISSFCIYTLLYNCMNCYTYIRIVAVMQSRGAKVSLYTYLGRGKVFFNLPHIRPADLEIDSNGWQFLNDFFFFFLHSPLDDFMYCCCCCLLLMPTTTQKPKQHIRSVHLGLLRPCPISISSRFFSLSINKDDNTLVGMSCAWRSSNEWISFLFFQQCQCLYLY